MEVCEIHKFTYEKDHCYNEAEYNYNNKHYCFDCLITEFNVEEHITTVYYDEHGEHLGTSKYCNEVIKNLDKDIEVL